VNSVFVIAGIRHYNGKVTAMKTSDFDYSLPSELIAQTPIERRDRSRLLVLDRGDGSLQHRRFYQIANYLRGGDVLVFNDSRVIPARLSGRRSATGGGVEILLLRRLGDNKWETLVKPAKRIKTGGRLELGGEAGQPAVTAEVVEERDEGIRVLAFSDEALLSKLGQTPLPPYIHHPIQDPERYQTVYAHDPGSAAAPTAGLHFTPQLLKRIADMGVECLFVTLHIGLDTFLPVREEDPTRHHIHREYGILSEKTAESLSRAKREGRRVICVGTTAVRLVEAAAQDGGADGIHPLQDWVSLFILPGYRFRAADAMITNFHLPQTTLLMMVSAFAGWEAVNNAYREAIAEKYRFYSFGDAMLIL